MGKGTDKLYITHSEWASGDTFSASAGSGVAKARSTASGNSTIPFKRLPFNFCALSLQPFTHPVCTEQGTAFELTHILPWIKKHGTNPVDGKPLKSGDLIKLNFSKSEEDEFVDPVTGKAFTDNSHVVAIKPTGNVYTHDTIHRLNVKAKNWHDLISDEPFTRADIITLQDPQHLAARDMTNFKYLQDGASTLTEEQERERRDPTSGLNLNAMGSSAKVLRAKEAVARAREERKASNNPNMAPSRQKQPIHPANPPNPPPKRPQNTSHHTSGLAAASLTSTGLTPHTSTALTTLTEEEALLSKPRKVKHKGYARMTTTHGALNLELNAEYAPRATWNFLALAKRGYYDAVPFHRNIRNFMIQGGDPAGTGRGGESCWGKGKPFKDEWMHSPLSHDSRGVLSMANKGRDTNTSQFFVAYRPCRHLDRKHTIFGRVLLPGNDAGGEEVGAESEATLRRLEAVDASEADSRPLEDCAIDEVQVLIDPFDEHRRETAAREGEEREREEVRLAGGTEDDRTTWTGKRVRAEGGGRDVEDDGHGGGVGKYLGGAKPPGVGDEIVEEVLEEWEEARDTAQPPAKKRKAPGDFGNFDAW